MSLTSLNSFLFLVHLKCKWSRGGEEFCCHFEVKTETDTQIIQEAWDVPVCWRWCQNLRFDAVQMCQHRTLSLGDLPNGAPHPALEIHQGKTQWVAGSTTSGHGPCWILRPWEDFPRAVPPAIKLQAGILEIRVLQPEHLMLHSSYLSFLFSSVWDNSSLVTCQEVPHEFYML